MRVKMLTSMAGPALCLRPGDFHDLDRADAERLIAAGICVAVAEPEPEPEPEQAPEPEPVKKPRGRRKAV